MATPARAAACRCRYASPTASVTGSGVSGYLHTLALLHEQAVQDNVGHACAVQGGQCGVTPGARVSRPSVVHLRRAGAIQLAPAPSHRLRTTAWSCSFTESVYAVDGGRAEPQVKKQLSCNGCGDQSSSCTVLFEVRDAAGLVANAHLDELLRNSFGLPWFRKTVIHCRECYLAAPHESVQPSM